jgi:hypothetical protein
MALQSGDVRRWARRLKTLPAPAPADPGRLQRKAWLPDTAGEAVGRPVPRTKAPALRQS